MIYPIRQFAALCLCLLGLLPTVTLAKLTGASVNPKQGNADITQGQSFNVRWVISTTTDHSGGVFSSQGQIIDPVTGAVLTAVTHPLNRNEGAGPVVFEETLALTPEQLQNWQSKGISAVAYQRSFSSAAKEATVITSELTIYLSGDSDSRIPRAPAAGLFFHKLGLRFENARNRRSFPAGSSVRARVEMRYSGTGLLQGEWQIAREQTGAKPLFTSLVSVRKQLPLSRREFLVSPELPTSEPGQYRVRFCVVPQVITPEQLAIDSQCPEPELTTELMYRVGPDTSRESVEIELVTSLAITVTPTTTFQWKPAEGTAVYQLQIFKAEEGIDVGGADFVLRMLCGGNKTQLHLSEMARQQLQPGEHYRWRITAHDENGQLIGTSTFAEFTYLP